MLKPLTKISRFGSLVEVVRFEKPLIRNHRLGHRSRRQRSKSTFKIGQNIWRVKRNIRRKVAICSRALGTPAFASFTYAKAQNDMQEAIQDWRTFTRRMRRAFPAAAFLRVPERHKSGAVHFHAVVWGLPKELPCFMRRGVYKNKRWIHDCPSDRKCERQLRALAGVWQKGFVDLNVVRTPDAIGPYLANYLTKGKPDWTLFGVQLASGNALFHKKIRDAKQAGVYWELSSYSSPMAVATQLEDLGERGHLRKQRTFETRWLGSAIFEVYELPNEQEGTEG